MMMKVKDEESTIRNCIICTRLYVEPVIFACILLLSCVCVCVCFYLLVAPSALGTSMESFIIIFYKLYMIARMTGPSLLPLSAVVRVSPTVRVSGTPVNVAISPAYATARSSATRDTPRLANTPDN